MKRHGLTKKEIYLIAKEQGFVCPLTNHDFWADKEMKVLLSSVVIEEGLKDSEYPEVYNGYSTERGVRYMKKAQRVCIDHDHQTNLIRGVLSQEGNILCRETCFGSGKNSCFFGDMQEPLKLKEYRDSPPAFKAVGKRMFK